MRSPLLHDGRDLGEFDLYSFLLLGGLCSQQYFLEHMQEQIVLVLLDLPEVLAEVENTLLKLIHFLKV